MNIVGITLPHIRSISMKRSVPLASLLVIFASTFGTASAQDSTPPSSPNNQPAQHENMSHMNMGNMNMGDMSGMHEMPATVLDVDHKSGIVEVNSENMKLKVHFPPNTI